MTQLDLKTLEKVFAAEIEMRLPWQSKSKRAARLAAEGYLELVTELRHYRDGWPPLRVRGYVLTHRGRIAYCESCKDVKDE